MTECVSGIETVFKVACVSPAWLVENIEFSYINSPMLKSFVRSDFSFYYGLQPGHLEQLAISCPNIQQLNLQCSHDCLRRLQGLQAIVTHCSNLQRLNVVGSTWVENQVQLWQMLSDIKLIYLVVDLCVVTLWIETN